MPVLVGQREQVAVFSCGLSSSKELKLVCFCSFGGGICCLCFGVQS